MRLHRPAGGTGCAARQACAPTPAADARVRAGGCGAAACVVALHGKAAPSFIGVGIRPPAASRGVIINQCDTTILATLSPILFPAIAIALTRLSFTFVGDGLRDALDPRTRG